MTLQSFLLRLLPLPQPGRVLADGEWRTLARIAEALLPTVACGVACGAPSGVSGSVPPTVLPGPSMEGGLSPEDVADNVERFLIRGRSKRAWRVRGLLQLVEWTPLLRGERPLSRMTLDRRRRLVKARYIDGRGVWGICAKVRYLVLMGAYGDARLHATMSYVPVSQRVRFAHARPNGAQAVAP